MAIVYVDPLVLGVVGPGVAHGAGGAAWLMMAIAFQPMLRFYRRSPLWGLALPFIALFYAGATWTSAWHHWQGRGGMWKGRAQSVAGRVDGQHGTGDTRTSDSATLPSSACSKP